MSFMLEYLHEQNTYITKDILRLVNEYFSAQGCHSSGIGGLFFFFFWGGEDNGWMQMIDLVSMHQ